MLNNEILTELEVLEFFDIKRRSLDRWRHEKRFPYISISAKKRYYDIGDILSWMRRFRINRVSTE